MLRQAAGDALAVAAEEGPLTIQASPASPGIRSVHPALAGVAPSPAPASTPTVLPSPLAGLLVRSHERHRRAEDGTVATYIPELGRADPAWFGIAAVTTGGEIHAVGDAGLPFTIQSISKPLTYGLVLDDLGEDAVRARIGVEPTGDAFNAITLAPDTGRPLNPMVNAGAIAAAGLARGAGDTSALDVLLAGYARFAGRPLSIDEGVLASERATGHRNRAIGQLLRASGAIDGDVDSVVERYFAQCSVSVTAIDLAVIAATLANGGRNPVTGIRALSTASTRAVLSVMTSCGMYDGAGEWIYTVGLPAKSGVSGGMLVVVPGQLGLAVFSPPLDGHGNSVRGVRVCHDLVRDLGLHPLRVEGPPTDVVRSTYRLSQVGSKRVRPPAERSRLATIGARGLVVELQGTLSFLAPDRVAGLVRAAQAEGDAPEVLILDAARIDRIDPASIDLLGSMLGALSDACIEVLISGRHRIGTTVAALERAAAQHGAGPLETTDDLDTALEAAEDDLLGSHGRHRTDAVVLGEQALVQGLDPAALAILAAYLERRVFPQGTSIVARGEAARELFLVESGRASVTVDVAGQGRRRLATLGAGMTFGESALLEVERRTADVRADTEVVCLALSVSAFDRLLAEHPAITSTLLRNLLRTVGATAARLTREVAVLAGS